MAPGLGFSPSATKNQQKISFLLLYEFIPSKFRQKVSSFFFHSAVGGVGDVGGVGGIGGAGGVGGVSDTVVERSYSGKPRL